MVSFVALYRGRSVAEAELVAVGTDAELVGHVAGELLRTRTDPPEDPAVAALHTGRRRALRIVRAEAEQLAGAGAERV
jgi:hypothetical protein